MRISTPSTCKSMMTPFPTKDCCLSLWELHVTGEGSKEPPRANRPITCCHVTGVPMPLLGPSWGTTVFVRTRIYIKGKERERERGKKRDDDKARNGRLLPSRSQRPFYARKLPRFMCLHGPHILDLWESALFFEF